VAYVRRYIPVHEAAAKLVNSGQLGPVFVARVIAGQPFTKYRPDYRQTYYASRAQGGGCTLDFASHFVDLVQYYLGPIESMRGYARRLVLEGVEVDDTSAMSFEFKRNHALGSIHINQFQPVNENIIDFCGPRAVLRILESDFSCRVFREGADDWEDLRLGEGDYADGLRRQAAAFVAAIDGGPAMRAGFAEAAHTLRLCLDFMETGFGSAAKA
jgi:predicted dehydrogenase